MTVENGSFRRPERATPFAPPHLVVEATKLRDLRYGENPHQPAGWYALDPPAALGAPTILQGKELSFTNLLDLDAAARHRARVRRAGRLRDQAHQSLRRGDR